MNIRDPGVTSGEQFCRNCGGSVAPGSIECAHCGTEAQTDRDQMAALTQYLWEDYLKNSDV